MSNPQTTTVRAKNAHTETTENPLDDAVIERVALAIEASMFAAHELP